MDRPSGFDRLLRSCTEFPSSAGLLGCAVILAVALTVTPARAADSPDVFAVEGVPVDATAANAVAARDTARLDGERRALRTLLERLTLAADQSRLPRVADQRLPDLVRDFEVANERSSGVRYLAEYSFRFRPDDVRALLRQTGIPFTETLSKPVVLLPVFHGGETNVLWEDSNPWRDAWANRKSPDGLVPVVVPLGDAGDVAAIDADHALAADPAAVATLAARYNAVDALLAVATATGPGEIGLTVRRIAPDSTADLYQGSVKAAPGESDADLMSRAVILCTTALEEAWKRATMPDFSRQASLTADVPLSSLADWVAIRNGLGGIAAVTSSSLVSLAKQSARVEIHYLGDPAHLRLALAQHDLVLGGGEGSWTLQKQSGTNQSKGDQSKGDQANRMTSP